MRMVFNIAKAELRNLFFSPVAWFLLITFLVQCGYFYSSVLSNAANWQDILIKNNPDYAGGGSFTRILFLNEDGFFTNVMSNLYLFVPLLTMGLIGREVQNGTVKLLYSSPVKIPQIVIGKYLAIMVFNLILVLVVGIFMVTAIINVRQADYGMLVSAALGFFLLTCAYTAIGAFMSSITTYQIVAAIGTFLVILLLTKIGYVWQKYDFFRDLTFFLYLPGRAEKMLVGLLTTKDVIYFFLIIGMFLGFTMLKLQSAREAKPWTVQVMRYSIVIVSVLMLGYISSRPVLTGYWDTTEQDVNTIHGKTQQLISEMGEEELEVVLYENQFGGGQGLPENRNNYLTDLWEKYVRFKPGIKFSYVYYYDHDSAAMEYSMSKWYPGLSIDQISKKMADKAELDMDGWLKPHEIRQKINLLPEKLRTVMQLKYKGRTEFLRTYNDNVFWPEEDHVAAVFKRLLYPEHSSLGFITGHYERNTDKKGEREFRDHTAGKEKRRALINLGFDIDTLSLDHQDIPATLTTLVLADPKSELSPVCLEKIRQFINRGGNMFIMGEPGKQEMTNPVLNQIGVNLMDGILVARMEQEMPDMQQPTMTNAYFSLKHNPSSSAFKKVKSMHAHLLMHRVAAIDYTDTAGFTSKPLFITTTGHTWLKKGIVVPDSAMVEFNEQDGDQRLYFPTLKKRVQFDSAKTEKEAHDEKGAFVSALAMFRTINNKEQRIVVTGDADFISNMRLGQHKLGIPLYSWLEKGTYPIQMPRPDLPDVFLNISGKSAKKLEIFYVWILPGLVLLAATILLIRRKRK